LDHVLLNGSSLLLAGPLAGEELIDELELLA